MTDKIPITISEKLIALNARLNMDDIDVIYEAVERIEQLEAALREVVKVDCGFVCQCAEIARTAIGENKDE
jgi:hypothetical protein